ncbi:SRPBCC domain-containing protein [Galbibacter sp. EGI 63066]|uniref:SRPBCC family protein n=1 Tax=Galbibacter sp. EGI 63066 TaxID=2993559 RepID=UPI002249059B|nr:SRPBCC domain-containing protein [Galbibacter sp. EGI 63066]MCX2679588.1 SRPBCC domain-containing protein [Galbibacter sp. EGI 63066]
MKDQTIIVETTVDADVKTVWSALTNPEKMKAWYFVVNNFELKHGNEFYFYEPGGTNFKHVCKILEIIPEERLRHTWSYPELSKGISVLNWQLRPHGKKTKLKLKHSGIENLADGGSDFSRENFIAGWEEILKKNLKDFLFWEKG